jgi:hypothetical protein
LFKVCNYLYTYNKPPKFKASHTYPIIRLPREFNNPAGVKGTVFQTIYKEAFAFLVVINDRPLKELVNTRAKRIQKYDLYTAEVGRLKRPEPIVFPFINGILGPVKVPNQLQ